MTDNQPPRRLGVYLIGACGAVSTTCVVGARALAMGLAPPTGMVTALADFASLPLAEPDALVFGGCEIRRARPLAAAQELCGPGGFLRPEHVDAAASELDALADRLDPGLIHADCPATQLDSNPRRLAVDAPRQAISLIQEQLAAFARKAGLDSLVVVNLASTEAHRVAQPHDADLAAFERQLDTGRVSDFPVSSLYAYAALDAGHPFLNFTPSPGSSLPALVELAEQRGVAHMGRDGKTGETLLKTTLAPMMVARNFRVLAWEGHNILGNRDGQVLDDPASNRAKQESKGASLASILGDPCVHSRVRIDYVPSLADWKTAWDFIHFEGFLGTRMILQLIWQGCDSILAAPLVLDMVRLLEYAQRRGQGGLQAHLACFFKAPMGVDVHAFDEQFRLLQEWAARERQASAVHASR